MTSRQENPNLRWANGYGYRESPRFFNAIQKYGWDNFWHIIIKRNMSITEASTMERYFIKIFRLQDPDYGYNISEGGGKPPYIGHPLSESTKQKIGKASKERWNKLSEEEKKVAVEHLRGSPKFLECMKNRQKKVLCVETGEIFESLIDAGKSIRPEAPKKVAKCISQHCKHPEHWKSAYGKHWKILE